MKGLITLIPKIGTPLAVANIILEVNNNNRIKELEKYKKNKKKACYSTYTSSYGKLAYTSKWDGTYVKATDYSDSSSKYKRKELKYGKKYSG